MAKSGKMTPLMKQYWEIKNQHEDKLLLFRMGDFFEMFHQDAEVAAPILNIALTFRNKKSSDDTKMCGVPHHSIAGPVSKLLAAGHKVAICDQVEDPKEAVGLVKRAVTRILSPGMVYDPETLDQLSSNYLCSFDDEFIGFLEASTGEAFYYRLPASSSAARSLKERVTRILNPVELVVNSRQKSTLLSEGEGVSFMISVHEVLPSQVPEDFRSFPKPCQRLVAYALHMQGEELLSALRPFEERTLEQTMELSPTVLRHLEVFKTYKGETKGSLFHAINRTKSSAGARRLKNWMQFPLMKREEIALRQDEIEFWLSRPKEIKEMRQVLQGMGDVERRIGKIANPTCNARDLQSLVMSLRAGMSLSPMCRPGTVEESCLQAAEALAQKIEAAIVEDPPVAVNKGQMINKGFRSELDELIELAEHGQQKLNEMEAQERDKTGIPSLKIRYNNVFGYYIEVTNTHKDKVPDHYKRKQTLANAERYLTQELQELEEKILSARSKRSELEREIFDELRRDVAATTPDLMSLARAWSEVDVLSSLAWLSMEYNYKRPQFSEEGHLELTHSRHPVVEQEVAKAFVPNSLHLSTGECLLLTGPNMAGKSTMMRQVAALAILAQMGSFVPAEKAILPIYERIFTRIGASDYLNEGLSTFMVEMQETADLLKSANPRSLVVLDEIGRGTSTYDGMSLAQSILEYLVTEKQSMVLFATHYHELTSLDRKYNAIKNAHMTIKEEKGEIRFLHKLVLGPANKSYGIQVAKLAGLPGPVTQRAAKLLAQFESGATADSGQMSLMADESPMFEVVDSGREELLEEIKEAAIQTMTPIEALNTIAKWQQSLS